MVINVIGYAIIGARKVCYEASGCGSLRAARSTTTRPMARTTYAKVWSTIGV
jgi:hypothetical protein